MSHNAHQHFVLYKPDGYLSQFTIHEPRGHRKKLLGDFFDFPEGSMAVGRLDEASEGLLILTTNGKLSDYINQSGIQKEYYAQVDGSITSEAIAQLNRGVTVSHCSKTYTSTAYQAKRIANPNLPPRNKKIRGAHHGPTSWVAITLTEGKYRQVRKMTAAVGFPTLRLVRIRIGKLHLNNLQPGMVNPITDLNCIAEGLAEV